MVQRGMAMHKMIRAVTMVRALAAGLPGSLLAKHWADEGPASAASLHSCARHPAPQPPTLCLPVILIHMRVNLPRAPTLPCPAAGPGRGGVPELHGQRVRAPGCVAAAAAAGGPVPGWTRALQPVAARCVGGQRCCPALRRRLRPATLLPCPLLISSMPAFIQFQRRVAGLPAGGQRLVLPLLPPPVGACPATAPPALPSLRLAARRVHRGQPRCPASPRVGAWCCSLSGWSGQACSVFWLYSPLPPVCPLCLPRLPPLPCPSTHRAWWTPTICGTSSSTRGTRRACAPTTPSTSSPTPGSGPPSSTTSARWVLGARGGGGLGVQGRGVVMASAQGWGGAAMSRPAGCTRLPATAPALGSHRRPPTARPPRACPPTALPCAGAGGGARPARLCLQLLALQRLPGPAGGVRPPC